MKTTSIIPQAISPLHNGEAATPGEASDALNLREREQCLEVVGIPKTVANITAGDTLLAVDGDRHITLHGSNIMWGENTLATVTGTVKSAHIVGQFLVVVTSEGYLYFHRTSSGYTQLNISDAIPDIYLSASAIGTMTTDVDAYTFANANSQWQYPLASDDVKGITSNVSNAWKTLLNDIHENGQFAGPMLVRYGVRLWDDSYLWISSPVLIGADTIKTNYRSTTEATQDGSSFTGIAATTLSANCYQLCATVVSGVSSDWTSLVKSIDIFATDEVNIASASTLDYRIGISTASGTRKYLTEIGPSSRSKSAITADLLGCNWHLVASTTHIADLSQGVFNAINMKAAATSALSGKTTYAMSEATNTGEKLSLDECASLHSYIAQEIIPTSTMSHNGKLYTGGLSNRLTLPWNPMMHFAGTINNTACEATTIVTLATNAGEATVVRKDDLAYTPTALSPMLSMSDARATHIRIEIKSGSTVTAMERDLSALHDYGMAASVESTLSNIALSASTASGATTSNNIIAADGTILVSGTNNPLVMTQSYKVTGASIVGLSIANKPIYSGGFGRYPVYIFTNQGIFALPQNTSGSYGEAKLLSRKILADGFKTIEGDQCVWMVTSLGQLCSVSGSNVSVHRNHCEATQLAWNDVENELWMLDSDGKVTILMNNDHSYRISLQPASLFADGVMALAVMINGDVKDLHQEESSDMDIYYLTHPFSLSERNIETVKRIEWHIFGENLDVKLALRGERGASCHGFLINRVHATGTIGAPIILPIISQPARNFRLEISGKATTNTLLLPIKISGEKQ